MGLLDRFLNPKQRTTPEALARATAEAAMAAAVGSVGSLDDQFRRLDAAPSVPSDRYFLELLVVALFPHDLLLALIHGDRAFAVRRHARALVLESANESRAQVGAAGLSEDEWLQMTDDRFHEYSQALQFGGAPGAKGMERFAFAVASHVCAPHSIDPGVAVAAGAAFASTMKQFRPVLERIEIVDAPAQGGSARRTS